MRDILSKKKLALQNHETNKVCFPRYKPITVAFVLKQALSNPEIAKYLPDEEEEIDGEYLDRDFLFTVVNRLEPSFFPRALRESHDITKKADKE
jgi:hypothetical protein